MNTARASLRADGWGTAIFGVVMLPGGLYLSGPLGLPAPWFAPLGAMMLTGGVALVLLARRAGVRTAARAAAGVNALAAVAILALIPVLPLTALGVVFLLAGAAWVATFAVLEARACKHEGRPGNRGGLRKNGVRWRQRVSL
ncbi:hypothetical protein GCM10027445_50820 [Amycolatopsis endophytica]|uniref:Integral membrane protein n=1 Tax=Amycolatopsis endophytica TaxID=860233 RepID=A0A853AZ26_9PSEU|nr:hypothetical protein [Amycolatopsis endophytica]NYI87844.1 hypothetical protein [Amycolatopsis endophytica]